MDEKISENYAKCYTANHISLMLAQNQFVLHISIVTNSVATLWKEPDVGNLMIDWDLY